MKLFQVLFLNVATVAIALVVYDQLQGDSSGSSTDRASSTRSADSGSLEIERRLRALEARSGSQPAARSSGAPTGEVPLPTSSAPTGGLPAPIREREGGDANDEASAPIDKEPTEEDIRRFRQLQEAVRRQNAVKKNWERVDRALNKAGVNLTPKQRRQVHEAYADFEPRIMRICGEIKTQARATVEAGGEIDRAALGEQANAQIQTEFAATLTGIVNHQADAEAVATALTARGGK